jgi:hypothetical protein
MATVARERRTTRRMIPASVAVGVAIAVIVAFGAVVAVHEVGEGGRQLASTPNMVAAPAEVSHAAISQTYATASPRLRTSMGWIDGLASGLILPADVTSRLGTQDPEMARTVMAVWSDLNPATTG